MKEQKKGISLIVLVIIIIVMLILASAVIVSLSNANIIKKAKEAVEKTNAKGYIQELTLTYADKKTEDNMFELSEIDAARVEDIQKYIPSFNEKHYGKLIIQAGEVAYVVGNVTEDEKQYFESIGIKPGSYITETKAREIKELAENTTIDTSVSTTDVATYITGIQEEYIDMFTIFQGKLYYRYEKTTLDERISLYKAGIPFLLGDINEDGLLTEEDSQRYITWTTDISSAISNSMCYVGDVDNNGVLNINDGTTIKAWLSGTKDISDYIVIEEQEPIRINYIGTYFKVFYSRAKADLKNTNNYKSIMECNEYLTAKEAKRLILVDSYPVYRYDKITEQERQITITRANRYIYSIGDGNFDGMVDSKDVDLVLQAVSGYTLTNMQKAMLDVNGDGSISTSDYSTLSQYVAGGITYQSMLTTYSNNRKAQ